MINTFRENKEKIKQLETENEELSRGSNTQRIQDNKALITKLKAENAKLSISVLLHKPQ